jgi:hypothetical protein
MVYAEHVHLWDWPGSVHTRRLQHGAPAAATGRAQDSVGSVASPGSKTEVRRTPGRLLPKQVGDPTRQAAGAAAETRTNLAGLTCALHKRQHMPVRLDLILQVAA